MFDPEQKIYFQKLKLILFKLCFHFSHFVTLFLHDTIETFLDARANDQASFDFTPPEEPSSMKFVCDKWSKNIYTKDRATITATFREVFEP